MFWPHALVLLCSAVFCVTLDLAPATLPAVNNSLTQSPVPCTCGLFLSKFTPGSPKPPTGKAALYYKFDEHEDCTPYGNIQCERKCIEEISKKLPYSYDIICHNIQRNSYEEEGYLWIKNCNENWKYFDTHSSQLFCCKNGTSYRCPLEKH